MYSVRVKGESPHDLTLCQLHLRDILGFDTLLETISKSLMIKHGKISRLLSNTGKEIKTALDLVPGQKYDGILSRETRAKKLEETLKSFSFNDQTGTSEDYMRIFVFRPYIPVYLRKDLLSYADLLDTVSQYYGFKIQSMHHLHGMEVRSSSELLPNNVYIAVEKIKKHETCEFEKSSFHNKYERYKGPNNAKHTRFQLDDASNSTGKVIYVRNLYSYRGSLRLQPCGLQQNDESSMPHLLNILASLLHPPGHYFRKLFGKNREEIKDLSKIMHGEEYLALPQIVSHTGWNFLHKDRNDFGWIREDQLSPVKRASFPEKQSRNTRNSYQPNKANIDHRPYLSTEESSDATSEGTDEGPRKQSHLTVARYRSLQSTKPQIPKTPSNLHISFSHIHLPVKEKAKARCPHSTESISDMHEILPNKILSALNDKIIVLCGFRQLPNSDEHIYEDDIIPTSGEVSRSGSTNNSTPNPRANQAASNRPLGYRDAISIDDENKTPELKSSEYKYKPDMPFSASYYGENVNGPLKNDDQSHTNVIKDDETSLPPKRVSKVGKSKSEQDHLHRASQLQTSNSTINSRVESRKE